MNIAELIEELDAFGDSVPVMIEDGDGRLFEISGVDSSSRSEGVIAFVSLGEKYVPAHPAEDE